jgi:dihydroxyacetone kinase phosphotransfer subunit
MTVGIVIVSHSPKVAEGTADMVRQRVGTMVPLGWCGGDGQGGLGSDVGAILKAIEAAWSDDGVAVLVDLGGAAMQAEMAIELLDEGRRDRVQICEAPLVEGAVIGATEASGGSDLAAVRAVAASALGASAARARLVPTAASTTLRGGARMHFNKVNIGDDVIVRSASTSRSRLSSSEAHRSALP